MSTVNINTENNTVSIQDINQEISVTDNNKNTTVSIPQTNTNVIQVNTPGPQGPVGPVGTGGGGSSIDTGSFATTGSNVFIGNQTISGSIKSLDDNNLNIETLLNGGAIVFDRTLNGYLTTNYEVPLDIPLWTIESWINLQDTGYNILFGTLFTPELINPGLNIYFNGTTFNVQAAVGFINTWNSVIPSLNTWHHIAISYDGSYINAWLDGTQLTGGKQLSNAGEGAYGFNILSIGAMPWTNIFGSSMKLTNLRINQGDVLYDPNNETITVPTSRLTVTPNTQLLLLANDLNTAYVDTAGFNVITNTNTNWIRVIDLPQNQLTKKWTFNTNGNLTVPGNIIGANNLVTTSSFNSYTSTINNFTSSINNKTSSFATTGSNTFNGNQIITGSLSNGFATQASGSYSHAEGLLTIAQGDYSHAEGQYTTANGQLSHAEGLSTQAYGYASHTEGSSTTTNGQLSHAEGFNTFANGIASHAEGIVTIAQGSYSHAEGYGTIASGSYSHAEGEGTTARGNSSHAEGYSTIAQGSYSHAEGLGTIASGSGQTVVGKWNKQNNTSSLFIIGNGTDNNNRSDIVLVNNNNVVISGSLNITNGITGSLQGSASFAISSSRAVSASFASTASYINTLNQNVQITGSVYINVGNDGTFQIVRGNTIVTVGTNGELILINSETGAKSVISPNKITIES
jgi:hypothetical protein